jgi:predicted nucleic acid-binding protein
VKAVDTSVTVAAFGDWHALNAKARKVLDAGAAVPAHVLLETYSVLTSFPAPHRAAPAVVTTWLADRFSRVLEAPTAEEHRALVELLGRERRIGGAVYDGLVALAAKRAGAVLVTADKRAQEVYELVGVATEPLT